MEQVYREVDFQTYCPTCKYGQQEEKYDPCNDCLAEAMNADSSKPIYWEEEK